MKVVIKDVIRKTHRHELHAVGCPHLNLDGVNRIGVNVSILEGNSFEEIIEIDTGGLNTRSDYKIFPCLKKVG